MRACASHCNVAAAAAAVGEDTSGGPLWHSIPTVVERRRWLFVSHGAVDLVMMKRWGGGGVHKNAKQQSGTREGFDA
jgi:hypothetical protein